MEETQNQRSPEEKAAELWAAWKKDGAAGIRRIAEARDLEYRTAHLRKPEETPSQMNSSEE